jgi:hypothetical protein
MSRQLIALISVLILQTVFASKESKSWGAITIKNDGAYAARFTVDYYINGAPKTEDTGKYPGTYH